MRGATKRMATKGAYLITCEHAGKWIPRRYAPLFEAHQALLESHRGWDPGADVLATCFAKTRNLPYLKTKVSRLLVENNRSLGHTNHFSVITQSLDASEKAKILALYYNPHQTAVRQSIDHLLKGHDKVYHLSVHTFTPELNGEVRNADIGLLYDPQRPLEKAWSHAWKVRLKQTAPQLRVRMNYPYLGTADGLTTNLRREYSPKRYAGIELEVNQSWYFGDRKAWKHLQKLLAATF